jgi:serine/threonine-protein kinase
MSGEDEVPPGEPRTVFNPAAAPVRTATSLASQPPLGQTAAPAGGPPAPAGGGRVEVGSVLNNMYEVKRLIGRGGMAEVFEGVNINDDHDRVAIKVMLPQLAADPNVQAMFRKEARTLTRISHPAVVQYRVLAQEPTLGVFYIVTEFIDGEPLSDALPRIKPTSSELRALTRRLAEGLRAAHALGAVHRDISPDNVLLPGKVLEQAKVIDFGIAKDLDPSKATIVGDGFAGKLGFVAPEQFGDFGREIGPWTDVYSLGLVVLAVAAGRNIDMGVTLVDAIDRRRAGPDLSVAPADLRPVLARMLAPNPADRLKSMDEVIALLDETAGGAAPVLQLAAPKAAAPPPPAGSAAAAAPGPAGRRNILPIAGAAVALLAALGAGAFFLLKPATKPAATTQTPATATTAPAGAADSEAARRAIEASLASVPCSWLDLVSVTPSGAGAAVTLTGVAGSTQGANAAVINAAKAAGISVPDVNLADVRPVDPRVCAALDALRPFRADTSTDGRRLSTSQSKYTLQKQPDGSFYQVAVFTLSLGQPLPNFAFFGISPAGSIDPLVSDKQQFEALMKAGSPSFTDLGGGSYRASIRNDPPAGEQGMLLLTGSGPFASKLLNTPPEARGPDWGRNIAEAARKGGWKAEMVWYRLVDPRTP